MEIDHSRELMLIDCNFVIFYIRQLVEYTNTERGMYHEKHETFFAIGYRFLAISSDSRIFLAISKISC